MSGGGAGQVYLAPDLARVFDSAEKIANKAGDAFVTVERLLLAGWAGGRASGEAGARSTRQASIPPRSTRPSTRHSQGRTADSSSAEQAYDALKRYARDLTAAAAEGKMDPVYRPRTREIRRTIQVLSRRHQEQPRADRRSRRRQDGHCRRLGPAHRQGRRAREPSRTRSCLRSTWVP